MADNSLIEWTDATWNPVTGCSVVSPGCANCYAMKLAGGRLRHHPSRAGLTQPSKAGPVWTGEVRLNEEWLDQPLRWTRPRRIFVCAHGDLFHENVPDAWIDRVFAVMALSPQHTFQVLTKRSARMRRYMAPQDQRRADSLGSAVLRLGYNGPLEALRWPLPNVWLGVSAEDQPRADERIPDLLETPAAVRFVSLEPLVGPVDLRSIQAPRHVPEDHDLDWTFDALQTGDYYQFQDSQGYWEGGDGPWREHRLDWVIAGGENGDRPTHPVWLRKIRDACTNAGVAFFFKQWGSFAEHEAGLPDRAIDADGDEAAAMLGFLGPPAWVHRDGRVFRNVLDLPEDEPCRLMIKVGKSAAGRSLDGVTWSQMPEPGR